MRETKFRVWDKKEHKYIRNETEDPHVDSEGNLCIAHEDCEGTFHPMVEEPKRYEVEWYTGLKDKNGKEIYEGDIVYLSIPGLGVDRTRVVEWVEGDKPYGAMLGDYHREVIGNIHENPELLEVSDEA